MKRFALIALLAVTSTVSADGRWESGLIPGLSAIAQRMIDMGVEMPSDRSIHPKSFPLDIPVPKAAPRVGFNG
jgi:hypothetical protein